MSTAAAVILTGVLTMLGTGALGFAVAVRTAEIGYEDGYEAGREVGASDGDGYSEGYDDGYEAGDALGWDEGWTAGSETGYDQGIRDAEVSWIECLQTATYWDDCVGY